MRSDRWNVVLVLLLAACVIRLWVVPLGASLWADETETYFVVHYGGDPQVPQSFYYWLPALAEKLGGFSEIVYRLPSLLSMAAMLFLIARLAAKLIDPHAAWFAVFLCFSLRGLNTQADEARPYALGMFVATAGIWFLVRWLDEARWYDALLFFIFAALLWRVQLVYWPFYLVFAFYTVLRLSRRETPVSRAKAITVFILLALALVPVALRALQLFAHGGAHVISPLPTPRLLLYALEPGLFLVSAGGTWLAARLLGWPRVSWPVSRSSLALLLAWWSVPALAIFAISWLSGQSLFVSRYFSTLLPGAALAGTALAARFVPSSRWAPLSALLGLGVLISLGEWTHRVPLYHNSDWRAASQTLNNRLLGNDTPVLCISPFVEAHSPAWYPGYPLPAFFYSPLVVYPVRGRIYPFPFSTSPEADQYASQLLQATFEPTRRFFLYGYGSPLPFWRRSIRARLKPGEWTERSVGDFGNVYLIEFDRIRSQTSGIHTR